MKRRTKSLFLMVALFAMTAAGCAGTITRSTKGNINVRFCAPSGQMAQGRPYIQCQAKKQPKAKKNKSKQKLIGYSSVDLDIWFGM